MELTYKLQEAGWAEAVVRDDMSYRKMRVSYLTDAMADLSGAAIRLVEGSATEESYWVENASPWRRISGKTTFMQNDVMSIRMQTND